MAADLKLRDALSRKVVVLPQLNPHEQMECTPCHPVATPDYKPEPSMVTDEFLNDDYADKLCYDCHKNWVELHPTDIDPRKSRMKVTIPSNALPLRFVHEGRYKVVCLTCHDIHFPHDGFKLLRGFSFNPKAQPSRYSDRISFCASCHGDQMEYLTPHKIRSRQTGCTLCHVRRPSDGKSQPLRANVNVLCTYCHPVTPEPHYFHFNPFPDLEQETIWKAGIQLRDGAYTCVTCHMPHGSGSYPAYLREEFVAVARQSIRTNPHEKGAFCQSCHTDPALRKDVKGVSTALIETDVNTLCNRCHESGKIKGMRHYLGPIPADMKVPRDLPLRNGKVTCITCHLPGCGPIPADNPSFLRFNPPLPREFCARCHDWKDLASREIHAEVRNNRGCEVCHQKPANPSDPASKPGETRADQNFVCIQCHDPDPHPAAHRHTVKPGEYEFVKVDDRTFPLDAYKRITCFSCHDTHQKIPSPKFVRGTSPGFGTSVTSCRLCHPF
jgi:hypothetical protein